MREVVVALPIVDRQTTVCTGELTLSVRVLLQSLEGCAALVASKNDFDQHLLDL